MNQRVGRLAHAWILILAHQWRAKLGACGLELRGTFHDIGTDAGVLSPSFRRQVGFDES